MKQYPGELVLRRMHPMDVEQVHDLDVRSFSLPWPKRSFEAELENPASRCWVIERPATEVQPATIIAAAVLWVVLDEGHLATYAIDAAFRRQGLGFWFLQQLIDRLRKEGVIQIFLEVRRGNLAAQRLYEKTGFEVIDIRKQYYPDTKEDALIMRLQINAGSDNERGNG